MKKKNASILIAVAFLINSGVVLASPSLAPFYESATKLKPEGKLGELLKKEEIKTTLKNAKAYRVAYISSDVVGKKTISTGLMVIPTTKVPSEGRGIVSWAHGTTGTAQSCGPSQVENPAVELNEYFLMNGNSWTDYGIPLVQEFIDQGKIVVATDYQGLGGGGKHQYTVSKTNGNDTVNIARAAASIKENKVNDKLVVYGWSQGGGAVLAVVNQPEYLNQKGSIHDGLNLIGAVGLAPEYINASMPKGELTEESAKDYIDGLIKTFNVNVFQYGHYVMSLWGAKAAFPEKLNMEDLLTKEGVKAINQIAENKCMHDFADTLSFNYGDNYKSLSKDKITNAKSWAQAFKTGSIEPVKTNVPVIIYWGTNDTAVPPQMHEIYREEMCAMGTNVVRVQLKGNQSHFTTPPVSAPSYLKWVTDRFDGKPVKDNCVNLKQE